MQAPLLSPRAFPSTNSSPFSSNQSSSENIKSRDHLFLSGNLSPAAVASVAFDGPSRLDDKDPAADGANMNGVSPFEAIRSKFALFDRMEDERKNLFQVSNAFHRFRGCRLLEGGDVRAGCGSLLK